jgi:hypothetical protein
MTDRVGKFYKPISNGLYNEQLAFGNLQLAEVYPEKVIFSDQD